MAEPTTYLLEVEERLAADTTGAERDALLARLDGLRTAAKRSLDRGLPPAEARNWTAMLAALDAAGLVIGRVWAHLHDTRR